MFCDVCDVQLCKTSEELRNAEKEVSRLRTALERNEKQYVNQKCSAFIITAYIFSINILLDTVYSGNLQIPF